MEITTMWGSLRLAPIMLYTVLLQIFARSLFLRILRVNLQSQKYDRKLIWRVVGGVSTYIYTRTRGRQLWKRWVSTATSDREEHGNRRSGYPRAKRTGVSSACWKSSGAWNPQRRGKSTARSTATTTVYIFFLYSIVYGYCFLSLPCVS